MVQVTVHIKGKTECYECQPKPAPKTYPVCTITSTPSKNAALESKDRHQKLLNRTIVTEILPAKTFYQAEEYHQQYLEKGGRFGFKQSADKSCNDPIR